MRPKIICHVVSSIDGRALRSMDAARDGDRFRYCPQGADNDKPAAGRSLRHLATETLDGGMVWLRYRVEKNTGA